MKYNVAFSCCSEDDWVANNMREQLTDIGISVYYAGHSDNADMASGHLRRELRSIYLKSSINVMFWSEKYMEKTYGDGVIRMEYDLLFSRHVGKVEYKSLYIYGIDRTVIPDEFEDCLVHSMRKVTFSEARTHIADRLVSSPNQVDNNKYPNLEHPDEVKWQRGPMTPCTFRLSANYKKDELDRWDNLADILVIPLNPKIHSNVKTFLIPSKGAPVYLSHPVMLRTNIEARRLKQAISNDFVKKYMNTDLKGMIFYIRNSGFEHPTVYCLEYDNFLNENIHKYQT